MKEALLYEKITDAKVHCFLCAHQCIIGDDKFGICGVRKNIKGALFTFSYQQLIAANVDPIEKKPLFHFLPGTTSYSVAAAGCNFRCGFCQNWQISQERGMGAAEHKKEYEPLNIVKKAKDAGCRSISYTYTEPTIFFEYALDIAKEAKKQKLCNVFVTNGYMTAEAIEMIRPHLDAANIDLKAFSDDFYKKVCGARLSPVLQSIKLMHKLGIWVELTTLIVPGLNDSEKELKEIAGFIFSVDKKIPWHISRYHPDYKMTDNIPTPLATLRLAEKIGREAGLRYVYTGNTSDEENTVCYNCKKIIIRRRVFNVLENNTRNNKCLYCNSSVDGVKLNF